MKVQYCSAKIARNFKIHQQNLLFRNVLFMFVLKLNNCKTMKYIEIKSEGYTYRYDFESVPSTNETFNPNIVIPTEDRSSASESLDICLDLLSCIFGKEEVRKAVKEAEV